MRSPACSRPTPRGDRTSLFEPGTIDRLARLLQLQLDERRTGRRPGGGLGDPRGASYLVLALIALRKRELRDIDVPISTNNPAGAGKELSCD
ncbi:hypothetical protein [Streptomyces goshikiensis]|uniref:hypothetical protein n=1 Tax=Streptomyces goshikiensis TaxID=1942 RepID=UPI003662949C